MSRYAIISGLGCNNSITNEQEIRILLFPKYYISVRSSVVPIAQAVTIMSLRIFSGPGWLDGVCTEADHGLVWTTAVNTPGVFRRPATLRAEIPTPRAEGQTEKR